MTNLLLFVYFVRKYFIFLLDMEFRLGLAVVALSVEQKYIRDSAVEGT
jgi:hypothetical protein